MLRNSKAYVISYLRESLGATSSVREHMTQSHKEVKELHNILRYVEASMSIMMKDKLGILALVYVYQMRKEKM